MARRPTVEVRIDAILDDSRRLARRLGRAGIAALLLLVIPIILLAAALGPGTGNEENVVELGEIRATIKAK